jgi:hypothetical protein
MEALAASLVSVGFTLADCIRLSAAHPLGCSETDALRFFIKDADSGNYYVFHLERVYP